MEKIYIQTPRLKIRHLLLNDLEEFHSYRSIPEVTKYQGFDIMSPDEAKAFIQDNSTKHYGKAGEWVQYAIENQETKKMIEEIKDHQKVLTFATKRVGQWVAKIESVLKYKNPNAGISYKDLKEYLVSKVNPQLQQIIDNLYATAVEPNKKERKEDFSNSKVVEESFQDVIKDLPTKLKRSL